MSSDPLQLENFCEALAAQMKIPAVKPDDDLFELGVDSIAFVSFMNHLNERLGTSLPVSAIFERPTVRDIVQYALESR